MTQSMSWVLISNRNSRASRPLLRENDDEEDSDEGNDSPRGRQRGDNSRVLGNGPSRRGPTWTRDRDTSRGSSQDRSGRRGNKDYRSEGEQPSAARNGSATSRRDHTTRDSFRAARMPKRGGRKRLRRVRSVRRKIRVSSYCVSRELQTLELLRWLETQSNRRLAQSLHAEGGTIPQGPVGSGSFGVPSRERPGTQDEGHPVPSNAREPSDALEAGSMGKPGSSGRDPRAADASKISQLEWMDSLYIDIIHSTTDLRGGLRKARELDTAAGVVDSDRSFYYDVDEDEGQDRRSGAEDDEDDDSLTHKDVMFFPYGAVVFWGCSEAEVRRHGQEAGRPHHLCGARAGREALAENVSSALLVNVGRCNTGTTC